MLDLILFIIISVSVTNIIQNETVFSKIRQFFLSKSEKLYSFLICPTCFGFWVGLFLGFFFNIYPIFILNLFFCGAISSIFNKIYAKNNQDEFGQI